MKTTLSKNTRRNFLKGTAFLGTGLSLLPFAQANNNPPPFINNADSIYLIGPQEGYAPHVGTLLSTMTMMRAWVVRNVERLSTKELDFQLDDKSNSIGAMLFHLAATEKYYQLHTFDGMPWGSWSDEIKKEWDAAMSLGKDGRREIKGYDINFYLSKLEAVREDTKKGFAERNDEWLMEEDSFFGDRTNNYCKWFHVCEHESNHNGQIKMIKKRLP